MSLRIRKTECFVPICPTCNGDMIDGEGMVPHFSNPWSGIEDPDEDDLTCATCNPIKVELTESAIEAIRIPADASELAEPAPTGEAPAYVLALIEAWATGSPLNLEGCDVPSRVRLLIEDVWRARQRGPVDRSPDGTERAGWPGQP